MTVLFAFHCYLVFELLRMVAESRGCCRGMRHQVQMLMEKLCAGCIFVIPVLGNRQKDP